MRKSQLLVGGLVVVVLGGGLYYTMMNNKKDLKSMLPTQEWQQSGQENTEAGALDDPQAAAAAHQDTHATEHKAADAHPAADLSTEPKTIPPELQSEMARVSYSIGMDIGHNFKAQHIEVDPALLVQGFKDSFVDMKPLLSTEQAKEALQNFQQKIIKQKEEEHKMMAAANLKKGQEFLANNKKKEGVVTLPSGLQYEVITPGQGNSPTLADTVTTHYKGTLIDGTEFDSSYKRNEPATFPVQGVIAGWTEALQKMQAGAKWRIFLPADLAYGERGAGRAIGPNETLIFDIELLQISPAVAENQAGSATQK